MGENIFRIIAAALIAAAVYFFWHGNTDGVFISAVLGSVAFFISIRFQVKERNTAREAARAEARKIGAGSRPVAESFERDTRNETHHEHP
jgi:hypothetical protein